MDLHQSIDRTMTQKKHDMEERKTKDRGREFKRGIHASRSETEQEEPEQQLEGSPSATKRTNRFLQQPNTPSHHTWKQPPPLIPEISCFINGMFLHSGCLLFPWLPSETREWARKEIWPLTRSLNEIEKEMVGKMEIEEWELEASERSWEYYDSKNG